ncbi:MAG: YraN family protein [Candidatus Harrisonbacteria bacterium CG10_big_fil_rev_8_21_14_0_10_49_15]|uniref:YraN family protein n=1 Tax=Candidatus Harrisonbacteria bacterium CG10_big_fil_rev_8_21_14_0_10_49_15 TaxID=1974587 RepID=A0A2H0UK24_9BACT|nr:MAG: YraN family protein [Candidatus Harrisonbacteria bacterium CG10_big_fil_rev_8_21_14_0_10_49_15]
MAKNTTAKGDFGEAIAAMYLRDNGYKILEAKFKVPGGELDLVCRETSTGVLVFAEVKTMTGASDSFRAEHLYGFAKQKKTHRSAQWYSGKYPERVGEAGWRCDLVAITVLNPILTDYKKDCIINHYQNV